MPTTKKTRIIAFSGSLRKESYTTQLLRAFAKVTPKNVEFEIIDISDLPFINQDLEENLPTSVKNLHKAIKSADAVLFATPEYNRSYSPVVKNAIDWGSRPQGKNAWDGKPAAVIGCSPYSLGGFGAVNHLRQVMLYVNLATMQQPEFYLSFADDKMDKDDNITDKETQKFVGDFWKAFLEWTVRFV
ncbi:MAG: NADPH-dependent oxidoreductase [Flavobacterium sp.]|uniref:NADPH-dependent FMN reductase n=1 Tax=Flavobacterium sp. TaxID=239 RepID=UPI0012160C60|nr:NAD(P)H-dependent oxidoreductase [Flavobacterium sp.]RZJ68245.1 MAG: NADPH-dependent oxidoreductase [Flavobacterium sp.]